MIATVHGRGYRFVAPIDQRDRRQQSTPEPTPLVAVPSGVAPLLEREEELAVLAAALDDARARCGRVVLLAGEAGMGKTALVRAFTGSLGAEVGQLHGACDDLVTPRALGPFDDMSLDLPALAEVLRDPAPGDVQRLLLAELSEAVDPVVMVVEDAHWADEATIDVLTYLVGRIERLPVTLVLTYRDNEVVDRHPLLRVLGRVPANVTCHVRLEPLSVDAVADLVGPERAPAVAGATGGVPFFVTEVASLDPADPAALPTSVAHAVLARVGGLPDDTRSLLEQISVEPSRTSARVLDRLAPDWPTAIAAAERAGMVTPATGWVAFRHELARRAVLEALPASRRRALHRTMAAALVEDGAEPDRIVNHAAAAGEDQLLVDHALPAAERAVAASANRQAWSHLERVLARLDLVPPERAPGVLELASQVAYHLDEPDEARLLALRALAAVRSAGDQAATGRLHRWLSRIHWSQGRRAEADEQAERAIEVLEPLGPSAELAWAYSARSQLAMLSWDVEGTERYGRRALDIAGAAGAESVRAHALINLAMGIDRADGIDHDLMDQGLAIARATGQHHEVVRGLIGVAYTDMERDLLGPAAEVAGEALAPRRRPRDRPAAGLCRGHDRPDRVPAGPLAGGGGDPRPGDDQRRPGGQPHGRAPYPGPAGHPPGRSRSGRRCRRPARRPARAGRGQRRASAAPAGGPAGGRAGLAPGRPPADGAGPAGGPAVDRPEPVAHRPRGSLAPGGRRPRRDPRPDPRALPGRAGGPLGRRRRWLAGAGMPYEEAEALARAGDRKAARTIATHLGARPLLERLARA